MSHCDILSHCDTFVNKLVLSSITIIEATISQFSLAVSSTTII